MLIIHLWGPNTRLLLFGPLHYDLLVVWVKPSLREGVNNQMAGSHPHRALLHSHVAIPPPTNVTSEYSIPIVIPFLSGPHCY